MLSDEQIKEIADSLVEAIDDALFDFDWSQFYDRRTFEGRACPLAHAAIKQALEADRASRPSEGWLPIASFDMDDEWPVLIYCPDTEFVSIGFLEEGQWLDAWDKTVCKPTFWQHRPDGPKPQEVSHDARD